MEKGLVIDMDDMVSYICVSLVAEGIPVNEELVRSILDYETDYMINYAKYEEEEL